MNTTIGRVNTILFRVQKIVIIRETTKFGASSKIGISLNFAQHHCAHHRFGRCRRRIDESLWRRILRTDISNSHAVDSCVFRNHPQDHRSILLAFARHAFYQDYPRAHLHHLPARSALITNHKVVHSEESSGFCEPRRSVGDG